MLYLSERLNYTTNAQNKILIEQSIEVHKLIRGLIAHIQKTKK